MRTVERTSPRCQHYTLYFIITIEAPTWEREYSYLHTTLSADTLFGETVQNLFNENSESSNHKGRQELQDHQNSVHKTATVSPYLSIISLNVNRQILQTKDTEWPDA